MPAVSLWLHLMVTAVFSSSSSLVKLQTLERIQTGFKMSLLRLTLPETCVKRERE